MIVPFLMMRSQHGTTPDSILKTMAAVKASEWGCANQHAVVRLLKVSGSGNHPHPQKVAHAGGDEA